MNKQTTTIVVDVATQKAKYVPPQIEVVELEKHTPLLAGSISTSGAGADLDEVGETDW